MLYVNSNENEKTFEELYRKYFKKIFNYIFHSVLNKEITEDLTANTFLNALRSIKINNPKIDNFNAWIYKIATNEIIKHKEKNINSTSANDIEDVGIIQKNIFINNDNDKDFDKFNDLVLIQNILKHLKPLEKILINLHFFEDKSYSEISKILNIKENTLRPTLSRIIKKMEKISKKYVEN